MTTIASPRVAAPHRAEQAEYTQEVDNAAANHDRLRSAVPVAAAVTLMFAVLLGGALLARNLLDLGLFFMTAS